MANPEALMHLPEVGVLTLGCVSTVSFGFGIGRYQEMFPFLTPLGLRDEA